MGNIVACVNQHIKTLAILTELPVYDGFLRQDPGLVERGPLGAFCPHASYHDAQEHYRFRQVCANFNVDLDCLVGGLN